MLEPIRTVRRAPFRFLSGIFIIGAGVVLIMVFLADQDFGLRLGTAAGFQTAGHLILMRRLREAPAGS